MDRPDGSCRTQGQIQVILGPMFSGKSTELIRRVNRFMVARHKCLLIQHDRNTRYTKQGKVCTHDGRTMDAVRVSSLAEAVHLASEVDVVAIDEGQFFSDTVEFCEAMADMGKIVIVAALDGTYRREPFGRILDIIPRAESVVKLNAICSSCCGEAAYSMRIGAETQVELIGGADKYQAACRRCHRNPKTSDAP